MAEDKKLVEAITSMDVDFAQWYTDVCKKAELMSYSSVKGCMIIEPYGFALWENLGYVAMYGLSTALVRAVTAVPGHACFGVFMGVYYGRAKRYDNDGDFVNAKRCRTMAVLMPALLHGAYDFIATMEDPNCEWVFLVFVLALFAVSLKLVRVGSRSDRYIDGGEGPLFF